MIKEDLRKWFKDRWVRMDTKGNIRGDCAREEGEGKPKCLPLAKARAMDKEDRALAVRRKRREDPVANRSEKGGKPINVRTKEMKIEEQNKPTDLALWSRAKALAKQKFDVYPSAYANGWAAKWYKSKGGSWKSVKEEVAESPKRKTFFQFREELNSCCDDCLDDSLYGSVEQDFVVAGDEQYEDWGEHNEKIVEVKQVLQKIEKPRNLVAKNANATLGGGAAGEHKNIKKTSKLVRGKKHKKMEEESNSDISLLEAEKEGRKVQLNKPFRTSDGKGKFAVYTKNDKGNVVKVNFGDTTGLTIKTRNLERRKNFRARHNCDNPGPRHKARYWSCKSWSKETVSSGLGI